MGISRFIFQRIATILSSKKLFLTKSLSYRQRKNLLSPNLDYIRYATLELCCEEIRSAGLKGSIAELGVYRGDFSKRLNQIFPEKKLYLFDTFEGFNDTDVAIERKRKYSLGNQDFSNTSIELVKSKMLHPENCVFKKGYFPQTAAGLQESFCFVSIDADLYEPIYQGLQFFYPRLEEKGFIFIHDFNNEEYIGAKKAVMQYCKENNLQVVPIPDNGGTAIITK